MVHLLCLICLIIELQNNKNNPVRTYKKSTHLAEPFAGHRKDRKPCQVLMPGVQSLMLNPNKDLTLNFKDTLLLQIPCSNHLHYNSLKHINIKQNNDKCSLEKIF